MGPVENLVEKLENSWGKGGKEVWKTRWKMCITPCSEDYAVKLR